MMTVLLSILLQVALGAIAQSPNLSAGSLCGYFPQDTVSTQPPKGYKPFYISLVARHGSRYLSHSDSISFRIADTLATMAAKGMLTADGLALMEDIQMIKSMTEGHLGELTPLGASEHQQICARMYRHYPEVFSNKSRLNLYAESTKVMRVQKSMEAFTEELQRRAPALLINSSVKGWEDQPANKGVVGYSLNDEEKVQGKNDERRFAGIASDLQSGYDLQTFAGRIFTDPQSVAPSSLEFVANTSFLCLKTGCLTSPSTMPAMDKYFTPEELYYLWLPGSMYWACYLNYPGYEYPRTRRHGGGMIEQIIEEADEAIRPRSHTAATLKFSHDTYLFPLMTAVPFVGTVLDCPETEIADRFQDYNFICPACNVQLIFYRKCCSKRILVKLLLNEKETLIHGLEPVTLCYYDWDSVKRLWQEKGWSAIRLGDMKQADLSL